MEKQFSTSAGRYGASFTSIEKCTNYLEDSTRPGLLIIGEKYERLSEEYGLCSGNDSSTISAGWMQFYPIDEVTKVKKENLLRLFLVYLFTIL